jgi:hypothetical protein
LFKFVESQSVQLSFSERIAPAKGLSHGGKITLLSGMQPAEEFSTLVHEIAHLCAVGNYVVEARRSVFLLGGFCPEQHITTSGYQVH